MQWEGRIGNGSGEDVDVELRTEASRIIYKTLVTRGKGIQFMSIYTCSDLTSMPYRDTLSMYLSKIGITY